MTFDVQQRRAARQLKAFHAAMLIRKMMGWPDPKSHSLEARMEEVRIAALSAVAEGRACMRALETKGIVSSQEVQDHLDWGYESILAQISAGMANKVQEAGG